MEADGQRLDEGAAGEGDVVWEFVAHGFRVGGELHEGAVEMGEDLCGAAKAHLRAEVVSAWAGEAESALATGQADFKGDAVADFEVLGLWACGCYHAGGLVAEAHGLADDKVAIAAVVVVVQI